VYLTHKIVLCVFHAATEAVSLILACVTTQHHCPLFFAGTTSSEGLSVLSPNEEFFGAFELHPLYVRQTYSRLVSFFSEELGCVQMPVGVLFSSWHAAFHLRLPLGFAADEHDTTLQTTFVNYMESSLRCNRNCSFFVVGGPALKHVRFQCL
jgi:hypothetical protein